MRNNAEFYGGAYVKDGSIHIIPLENTSMPYSFSGEEGIIYDDPVEYSLKDLNDAFMYLRKNNDALNLTGYSQNIIENGLKIYSEEEWTEEKKKI